MLNLLIADDEKKIGLLVRELIDWEHLELNLLGIVQDGREACDIILEQQPDIVITDIRMPNLSGLEMIQRVTEAGVKVHFIVISGYRYFEYAQTALKYGVEDYLLKPIEEEELNRILHKVCDEEQRHKSEAARMERLEKKLDSSRYILHKELLNQMIDRKDEVLLSEVNQEYGVNLTAGIFRALCVKVDRGVAQEKNEAQEKLIVQKIQKLTQDILGPRVTDLICSEQAYRNILVLLNYDGKEKQRINDDINELFLRMVEYGGSFCNYDITLGVSGETGEFSNIKYLLEMAKEAINSRIFEGTWKRIDNYSENSDARYHAGDIIAKNAAALERAVEIVEEALAEGFVRKCFADAQKEKLMAYEYYELAREIVLLFCTEAARQLKCDMGIKQEQWMEGVNHCTSLGMLSKYLVEALKGYLADEARERAEVERRPVLEAAEFIRNHYQEKITLEELADAKGFNANYFSELFKNETGKNFTVYLLEVRMDAAKALLRDGREPIYRIAAKVGYKDTKFFSRQFTKTVGIKPTEYRKLYY